MVNFIPQYFSLLVAIVSGIFSPFILDSLLLCVLSRSVVFDSLSPHGLYCSLPGFCIHGDSPSKDSGVGCHALLQEVIISVWKYSWYFMLIFVFCNFTELY